MNVLLSCSAAVLLTACGGNVDPGSEQLTITAAGVSTDAGAAAAVSTAEPAAAVEALAEAAPASRTEAAPAAAGHEAPTSASREAAPAASTEAAPGTHTAGATDQAADVTTQAFALTGYGSSPLQAQAGQQDAGANAQASIRQ